MNGQRREGEEDKKVELMELLKQLPVQAVVERPITLESNNEAMREVEEWKRKMARPTNLEQMPPDVQEIVERHVISITVI